MIILAIDPGTEQSALVQLGPDDYLCGFIIHNAELLDRLRHHPSRLYGPHAAPEVLVCEMVQHYGSGLAVGKETFETVRWIGRFQEAVESRGGRFKILYRPTIKSHLCGSAKAKDANVRQALIDRFGGDSVALKGKKCLKCKGDGLRRRAKVGDGIPLHCPECHGSGWERKPGPLASITSHMWAALAVAVTWAETQKEKP